MSWPVIPQTADAGLRTLRSCTVQSLKSATGNIEADHVCCVPSVHKAGHCIFGGDYTISKSGIYLALFTLEVTAYDFSSDPLVILDVYENLLSKLVLAERPIDRADLAENPRSFSLEFHGTVGQRVEFRAYWHGRSNLKAFGVTLKQRSPSGDPTSTGLSPERRIKSVSAIIPCFNGAPWLADAISSIQTQTRQVDEIIVVDDCSTDGSYDIAKKHNAIVVRNSTNSGEGYSRNVGLKRAHGDFIAWLDADDLWMPHHVETSRCASRKAPGGGWSVCRGAGIRIAT